MKFASSDIVCVYFVLFLASWCWRFLCMRLSVWLVCVGSLLWTQSLSYYMNYIVLLITQKFRNHFVFSLSFFLPLCEFVFQLLYFSSSFLLLHICGLSFADTVTEETVKLFDWPDAWIVLALTKLVQFCLCFSDIGIRWAHLVTSLQPKLVGENPPADDNSNN